MEFAGASGGVNLWRGLGRRRCGSAARARDRDQHKGRHQIAKTLHGRAKIIAAVAVAIIAILARCLTLPRGVIAHGGFTQREFAWLRITVPTRGAIPARRIAAFWRFGAWATFRAVTPGWSLGRDFVRCFGARRAVLTIAAATFWPATPAITTIRPTRRTTTAPATLGGGERFLKFGFRHRLQRDRCGQCDARNLPNGRAHRN